MTPTTFRKTTWQLATTLSERLAARRQLPNPDETPSDRTRATTRLKRWQSQIPFRDGDFFDLRLAADQISEQEFLHLLGVSAEAIPVPDEPPAWFLELEAAYAGKESWPQVDLPAAWMEDENIALLNILAPLLVRGRQRVRDGIAALAQTTPDAPFDPATAEEIVLGGLPGILQRMVARTLALELNVARLRGQVTGVTPKERFDSFVQSLCQAPTALAILNEYPVLARQIVQYIDRWARYSLEFLGHLVADWSEIKTLLPTTEPGPLVAIQGNAGDTHRGGRAVLIARFESGARLVYKPKVLSVDRHFLELLAWINAQNTGLPPFPLHRVLDRGEHGWVEFVEPRGCSTEDEVHRFYQRQGGYLALLYALEAMDFHSENLIAAGENPILPDLEALFHPRPEGTTLAQSKEDTFQALEFSVLRIGMLPRRIWATEDSAGMDVSGLGATSGQVSSYRVPMLEGVGTDSMRLVRRRIETRSEHNRPTPADSPARLVDFTPDVLQGFDIVYRLLQNRRDELLAPGGPIAAFADNEIRVIIRETRTYSVLLYESYHPDVLRDALDRDRLMDRLWVGIQWNNNLRRVIPAEREDMHQGDIPMFTTKANSLDLWAGPDAGIADYYTVTGMQRVEERLRAFDDADLARQRWIIEASMASTVIREPSSYPVAPSTTPASREAILAEAVAIGNRLEALAVRSPRGASWLGLNYHGRRHWNLNPLGLDLYNGLPGVALFLAYLGDITGESRFTSLAQATTTTLQQADPAGVLGGNVGGLEGWGGVLFTLAHLGRLWDRSALLAGAKMITNALPALIEKDQALDLSAGTAGCLAGLLCLQSTAPSGAVLTAAVRCGEHLLARAQPTTEGPGLCWKPSLPASAPLTGFANGAAGIAWALSELAVVTGENRYQETAEQALAYERSKFSAEVGNWPDLRIHDPEHPPEAGTPPEFALTWAHGAPGIGLARLQMLRRQENPNLRSELEVAVRTTLTQGLGQNHSLGHGDLGNLDLLLQAAEFLNDAQLHAEATRWAGQILESIQRLGPRCASPQQIETPGLMTGLAGIGLGLLRLAEPSRIPSVLVFAPPVTS